MAIPQRQENTIECKKRWSSGNVKEFLAFEPTETPKWRKEVKINDAPPISQMLKDIVGYKERYQQLKDTSRNTDGILEDLLVTFLCTIQNEEDIGVKEKYLTKSIMRYNSHELPRLELDNIDALHKKETSNLFKAYQHIRDELKRSMNKKGKSDATGIEFDLDSEDHDDKGFIEVETLIKRTHEILMTDIIREGTPPGQFSTSERETEFNCSTHRYPKFETQDAAEQAVQTLVDKVNDIIESIRQNDTSEEQKAKLYFKCSSMFLFCFLTLHPFDDGNGRLTSLLSSYNLLTYSQYLTPIYNVYNKSRRYEYVQALIDARNDLVETNPIATRDEEINCDSVQELMDERNCFVERNAITTKDEAINLTISIMHQKPSDLCFMLIESNWTVWRKLLHKLGDKNITLYEWEIENQIS